MGASSPSKYKYDIFLSYSHFQKEWTLKLAQRLKNEGFKVWFDDWCLRPGENWIDGLARGVKESEKLAAILSLEYINGEWTTFEDHLAVLGDPSARKGRIIPILYTEVKIPPELTVRQALDFSDTHDNTLKYEFRVAQLMATLDPSRDYPEDFDSFCRTHKGDRFDELPSVGQLPKGSIMPFLPNTNFVGREVELKSLYNKLEAGASVSLGQTAVATGLGGIGKTQLAVEFAFRYGSRFDGGVFWIDSADTSNIPYQIASCAEAMITNREGLTQDALVNAVINEWRGARRRLVIFDNVEQMEVIDKWRFASGGTRLLITSRIDSHDPRWKERGIEAISVDILPRDKSLQLLCRGRCDELDDPEKRGYADEICELLGDLPLAIHLAGAYLSVYQHDVSLKEYLDEIRSKPVLTDESLVDAINDPTPTKHIQNVAATFETSYQRLKDDKDKIAKRLFYLTAHFAPTSISRELLLRALKMDSKADKRKLADAINRLGEMGLVQIGDDGRIIVHRLLREFALKHTAKEQNADESAEDVARAIGDFAKEVYESGLPKFGADLEHLRYVTDESEKRNSDLTGFLNNELGIYLKDMIADLKGAKDRLERALRIDEAKLGKEHPNVATDVNNLGLVLQDMDDLAGAKECIERALRIDEAILGKEHPNVARDINNLGSVLHDMGNLTGAKECYERALRIDEAKLGKEHPNVAIRVNNLGLVLHDMGDLAGAKECFERVLRIYEVKLGKEHPNVATAVNNLGTVLQAMGDLAGAKECFERALRIGEVVYGKEHPQVATFVNNLGNVLYDMGDLTGAKECFERALRIYEKFLGADHPKTQIVRRNLQSLPKR